MAEQSKPKPSIHRGHRERVKQHFLRHGLDIFEMHEILELLLFYGVPQKDTNPIAHELLNRFGSLSGVLDAPVKELVKTKHVTENVAVLLKLIPQLSRYYIDTHTKDHNRIYDTQAAIELISPQFIGRKNEVVSLVLMDSKNRVLYSGIITEGSVHTVPLYVRDIVTLAATYNASEAIIAHNHPSGNVMPSHGDIVATRKLHAAMETIDVHLQDHIIFALPDSLSMRDCGLLEHILEEQPAVPEPHALETGRVLRIKAPFGSSQQHSQRLAFYEARRRGRGEHK